MGPLDQVLRVLAAGIAVAALLVLAADPRMRTVSDATATAQDASVDSRAANARARDYTYLLRSEGSRFPGRWCAGTITYTLDLTQVGSAGMDPAIEAQRWGEVMQAWATASQGRYRFQYGGERSLQITDDGQLDLESIESGTIGITYVSGEDGTGDVTHHATAVRGRTAGNAGLQVVSNRSLAGGELVGDRGFVMIDAQDAAALSDDVLRRALYLHESGHALGLGHVESATSIMNGTLSSARPGLAAGDITGVRNLVTMPCER